MFEFCLRWFAWGFDTSLKAVLIALIVAAVLKLLRASDSNIRHRAWAGVLSGMLLSPLLTPLMPALRLPLLPSSEWLIAWTEQPDATPPDPAPITSAPSANVAEPLEASAFQPGLSPSTPTFLPPDFPPARFPSAVTIGPPNLANPAPPPPETTSDIEPPSPATVPPPVTSPPFISRRFVARTLVFVAGGIWATIAAILALRLALGVWITALLRHSSVAIEPATLTIDKTIATIRECPRIRVPLTVGWLHPQILLPPDWRTWSADKLHAVLAHEQMHVQRADCLVALLAELNCCVYWFHPLAWWLRQQLSSLAEQACDDAAIGSTGDRARYARHLLEVAASVSGHQSRLAPLGVSMARRSNVETRILAILDFTRPLSQRLTWTKTLALLALLVPLITLAAALQPSTGEQPKAAPTSTKDTEIVKDKPAAETPPIAPAAKPSDDSSYEFAGTVVDNHGQPVAGARITINAGAANAETPRGQPAALTDEQGRFSFTRNPNDLPADQPRRYEFASIFAFKENYGFAVGVAASLETTGRLWEKLTAQQRERFEGRPKANNKILTLTADETPVRGRILNSDGQPVASAKIEVIAIWEGIDGNLDAWSAAAAERGTDYYMARGKLTQLANGHYLRGPRAVGVEPTQTNADGWFTLADLGRDRIAEIFVSGPGIETVMLHVRARAGDPIKLLSENRSPHLGTVTYYPREFTHIVGPSQPVAGRITDKKTDLPLTNQLVQASKIATHPVTGSFEATHIRATTNADGRYRLEGLPLGENSIVVQPPDGSRYLAAGFTVETTADTKPLMQNAALLPGVIIRGQITDRQSGNPLSGTIQYLAFDTNPHLEDARGFSQAFSSQGLQADQHGRYEIAVLPGLGMLTFMANQHREYPRGIGADKITGPRTGVNDAFFLTSPMRMLPQNCHLLTEINPSPDDTELTVDLTLTAGAAFPVRVRAADGQPLGEYYVKGELGFGGWDYYPKTADKFQCQGYFPSEGRQLMVYHPERNLVGQTTVSGDSPQNIEVVLDEGSKLKGRVIDNDGAPLDGLMIYGNMPTVFKGRPTTTDADGRFELSGLLPGVKYSASVQAARKQFGRMQMSFLGQIFSETTIESGQTKDLGNVKITEPKFEEQPTQKTNDKAKLPSPSAHAGPALSGKIHLPSNQPAHKAHVAIVGWPMKPRAPTDQFPRSEVIASGQTDESGRFQLPLQDVSSKTHGQAHLIARGEGTAVVWQKLNLDSPPKNIDLKLPAEQPLRVRLIDLEGQPASGVKLSIGTVFERTNGKWPEGGTGYDGPDTLAAWLTPPTADQNGRFILHGLAANHGIWLKTQASDRFSPQDIALNTGMPEERGERDGTYRSLVRNAKPGEELVIPLSPAQIFEGTIRYEDTKAPVPNAKISIWASQQANAGSMTSVEGKTDDAGRYHIAARPGIRFGVMAYAPNGSPYLVRRTTEDIRWENSDRVKQVDINLPRGVLVHGKVLTQGDKQPVANAAVQFIPNYSSAPNRFPGVVTGWQSIQLTAADGSYQIAIPPVPGYLLVNHDTGSYVLQEIGDQVLYSGKPGGHRYFANAIHKIDSVSDTKSFELNLDLEPAATITGSVVDEQGQSIKNGSVVSRLHIWSGWLQWHGNNSQSSPFVDGRFELKRVQADVEYPTHFLDPQRRLGATVNLKAGDENPTIVLRPCGSATVRYLDDKGQPLADHRPALEFVLLTGPHRHDDSLRQAGQLAAISDYAANVDRLNHGELKTDANGKLTIPALIPGATYWLVTIHDGRWQPANEFTVESNQTLDLGDITPPPPARRASEGKAASTPQTPSTAEKSTPPPGNDRANDAADNAYTYSGTVLDPTGKPLAGAKLHLCYFTREATTDLKPLATTAADGTFQFSRRRSDFDKHAEDGQPWRWAVIVATANGFGFTTAESILFETTGRLAAEYSADERKALEEELAIPNARVLKLVPDEPIKGRIVNIDGQPVAGAKLLIDTTWEGKEHSLDAWEKAAAGPQASMFELQEHLEHLANGPRANAVVQITPSDRDGWLTIRGLGKDRLARVQLIGPGIESAIFFIRSRPGEIRKLNFGSMQDDDSRRETYYPSTFTHAAAPSQPVIGRITDTQNGKPISGCVVQGSLHLGTEGGQYVNKIGEISVVTDADGRYRLEGLHRTPKNPLSIHNFLVLPPHGTPYVPYAATVKIGLAAEPITHDVKLRSGIIVRGQAIDSRTGEPILGSVRYCAFGDNPAAKAAADFVEAHHDHYHYQTDSEGRYEIPVLPGKGVIAFHAHDSRGYPQGVGLDEVQSASASVGQEAALRMLHYHHLLKIIDLQPDIPESTVNLTLKSAPAITGRVLSPAGQPLKKYFVYGSEFAWIWANTNEDTFEVKNYDPAVGRRLLISEPEQNLVAVHQLQGAVTKPFEVRLSPGAIIKGRIVDADGLPLEGIHIANEGKPVSSPAMMGPPQPEAAGRGNLPFYLDTRKYTTDKDGRFELRGIIPGLKYTADCQGPGKIGSQAMTIFLGRLFTDVTTNPGETKDLGDVKITPPKRPQAKAQGTADKSKLLARSASEGKTAPTPQTLSATEKSPPPPPVGEAQAEGKTAFAQQSARTPSSPAATELRGRVFGGAGAVVGAKIYWFETQNPDPNPQPPRLLATTDASGDFHCTLPASSVNNVEEPLASTTQQRLVVVAPGHGFVFTSPRELRNQIAMAAGQIANLNQPIPGNAVPIVRLPPAGDPIRGRLVNIDGQPVAGATVRIRWFDDARANRSFRNNAAANSDEKTAWTDRVNLLIRAIEPVQLRDCLPSATTDATGNFELRDLGANRLFHLLVQSDQAESKDLVVRNQLGAAITIPPDLGSRDTELILHPREFVHAMGPSKRATGRVIDRDTGEPIPGAVIRAYKTNAISHFHPSLERQDCATTTDAQGRFRISGLPPGDGYQLVAFATGDVPYIPISRAADASDGELASPGFRLQRGIWATGRVFDAQTDQPLIGQIDYFWFGDGKLEQDPGYYYAFVEQLHRTNNKGEFRVPVLPTRGVLGFHFPWATPIQEGLDRFPRSAGKETIDGHEKIAPRHPFMTLPTHFFASTYQRLIQVEPEPRQTTIRVDLPLTPSPPVMVRVVNAGGQPLQGLEVSGTSNGNWRPVYSSEFAIDGLASSERRKVLVFHRQRNLAGGAIVSHADKQPIEIKLAPAGSVTGRLIDSDGEPITDGLLNMDQDKFVNADTAGIWAKDPNVRSNPTQVPTDRKGRFRLDGLIPGWTYSASVTAPTRFIGKSVPTFTIGQAFADIGIAPGETKDLGDLKITPPTPARRASQGKPASTPQTPTANEKSPPPPPLPPGEAQAEGAKTEKPLSPGAHAGPNIITLTGLVLLPNGQPAAGATIRAAAPLYATLEPLLGQDFKTPLTQTTADAAGRFTISFTTQPFGDVSKLDARWQQIWKKTAIAASLNGYGPAWVEYEAVEKQQPLTLQLVEDVPIHGRVIDLEGRPLPSVAIKIGDPRAAESEDLSAWIAGVKAGEMGNTVWQKAPRHVESRLIGLPSTVTTDAKGMVEIRGIGRERFVEITLGDENVAHRDAYVVTRPMETLQKTVGMPRFSSFTPVFGADFTFTADPARAVEGVVLDAKTRQPLAGVAVESDKLANYPFSNHRVLKTTTDKDGRFRLVGMPKGAGNRLLLLPNDDQPYFMREVDVPDPVGLGPAKMEIELHRGLWLTGRVTNKATGEPEAGAWLHYFPFLNNEFAKQTPEFDANGNVDGDQRRYQTKADGTFRLVGLPGRAVIGANSILKSYRQGVGYETIDAPKYDKSDWLLTYRNPINPSSKFPNVMREINPPEDAAEFKADLQLDPGASVKIRPTDAAGNPLTGLTAGGLASRGQYIEPSPDAILMVANLGPTEVRTILLHSKEKNLGRVITIGPDEVRLGQIDVQLQPCATVTGRVLLDDGSPMSGLNIEPRVLPDGDFSLHLPGFAADADGRFQATLFPGGTYRLTAMGGSFQYIELTKELTVQPGQKLDLGTFKLDKDGKPTPWKQ